MIEFLVQAIILLLIVGALLMVVQKIPGIPEVAKTFVYVISALFLILWLADMSGLIHTGNLPAWRGRCS